jgi:hypothetical protein
LSGPSHIRIQPADEAEEGPRPYSGKIAFSAPLARALIGAGPGDFSDFGGKADAVEVVCVAPIEA